MINKIIEHSIHVQNRINDFSYNTLKTRGGRIGSGMGLLLEALWGYYMNLELMEEPIEIAWMPDHQYNDFVCLEKGIEWIPDIRKGEICRIEVKSMNSGADESKAHFDVLKSEICPTDLLLVLSWEWKKISEFHYIPYIIDFFIGPAIDIIELRDALHLARGGVFVSPDNCPESSCNCSQDFCKYIGEPLNSSLKRERLSGPPEARPSAKVSYAANFGGLLRMIKTSSEESRAIFRRIRLDNDTAHRYISFIHRNYNAEELNQFTKNEWLKIARMYNPNILSSISKNDLYEFVKSNPNYQDLLRGIM